MFVNHLNWKNTNFYNQIFNISKQDRIKIVIASIACGILLFEAAYLAYSYFWRFRRVEPKIDSSPVPSPYTKNKEEDSISDSKKIVDQQNFQKKIEDEQEISKSLKEVVDSQDSSKLKQGPAIRIDNKKTSSTELVNDADSTIQTTIEADPLLESLNSLKSQCKDIYEDIYYVRFLNVQTDHPTIPLNFYHLQKAIQVDITDSNKGYHKGSCLYTPNSVQPLAAFDDRHNIGTQIGVEHLFALLIDPKVDLHYWSLKDTDRNWNRETHEAQKATGIEKYNPAAVKLYHNLFVYDWKTIHFSPLNKLIEKVNQIAEAAKIGDKYTTTGGKEKDIKDLEKEHNEAVISYHPEQHVKGFLVENTPKSIALAKEFKEKYKNANGDQVFKDVFLAYQDKKTGKLIRLDD